MSSYLVESRKINDKQVPLYFKFGTMAVKPHLTTDKYLSLENWICMFDQLDEILKSGNNSSSRNSFNLENGRLEVKTKWIKTTDTTYMGSHILKILNLRSSNVGKYYLKIDVRLHSNFDQFIKQLELKNRVPADTCKCEKKNESNTEETTLAQPENSSEIILISSQVEEVSNNSAKLSKTISDEIGEAYDIMNINSTVEEYIPTPSAASAIENVPTYQPEKNSAQIEINQMQSQYSPSYLNVDKDTSSETASYRPSTRGMLKTSVNGETKPSQIKKHKSRRLSSELFGSSDDENACGGVSSSSHSHKVKRKKSSSPKKDTKSSKKSERMKKRSEVPDTQKDDRKSLMKIGDITIRNLMDVSLPDILATYSEHQENLTEIFSKHLKRPKVHYKSKDIPPLVIQDILTYHQQSAMIAFLEENLVSKFVPHPNSSNSSDILFDAILPEWAFEMFCRKFDFTRKEALERLHLQATASLDNQSDSELM